MIKILTIVFISMLLAMYSFAETDAEQKYAHLKKLFPKNGFISISDWGEKNGLPDGVVKGYYSQESAAKRQLAIEMTFANGKQNGLMRGYTSDGKLYSEINYADGKENGISRTFCADGRLMTESVYLDGDLISKKQYDESGKILEEWKMDPYQLRINLLRTSGKGEEIIKVYEECYTANGSSSVSCGLSLILQYKEKREYSKAIKIIDELIEKYRLESNGALMVNDLIRMRQEIESKIGNKELSMKA